MVMQPYIKNDAVWSCPSVEGAMGTVPQVAQPVTDTPNSPVTRYWLWRFDRPDDPVPLDNFWGKTDLQAVSDLQVANNPQAGKPESPAEAELGVDPYFPRTIPSVPANLKGRAVHMGGRNRLFLDSHVKYLRDIRTN